MNLILDLQDANEQHDSILPAANSSAHIPCPLCQRAIGGIMIEPLCFNDVERAISLKKNELPSLGTNRFQKQQGRKHAREEDIEIQAESPYLLLSNSNSSISCSGLSRGQQRTGRWTNEESALVEFLVTKFDQGLLPLPHGIKLNEFLGDMLLCKSSRLTKKMKNAKLSTRSFVLGKACAQFSQRDREKLSMLQESFLSSLSSESTRLVLKLNLAKQWRTHFYNICLQVGYENVQANAWNASLQELDRRAAKAEEVVRNIRRRKMGLTTSSQYDSNSSFVNPNVFDFKEQSGNSGYMSTTTSSMASSDKSRANSHASVVSNEPKVRTVSANDEDPLQVNYGDRANPFLNNSHPGRPRTLSTDISISSVGNKGGRNRSFSEDFESLLDVLTEETVTPEADDTMKGKNTNDDSKPKVASNFTGPLLESILKYIESNNLPFHHVDLWVPSFSSAEKGYSKSVDIDQLMLYHAGSTSRRQINEEMKRMLHEFGVYSSYFSFEPGKGLPGRVYASGIVSWECEVHNKDPSDFVRVEGAELYGVKTAVAIPLSSEMVGRIVVLLYSCDNVPENPSLARDIVAELTRYSLEPKWKLVLDPNASPNVQVSNSGQIPGKLSHSQMPPAADQNSKNFANFSNGFTSVASDVIVESKKYTKAPDSIMHSNSSPTNIVHPSKIPMMPTVPRDTKGLSRQSPHVEMTTAHYMHKAPKSAFGSTTGDAEDGELAAFLHQNMPVVDNSLSAGEVSSSSDAKTLRPYFMSFRLLLMRPPHERTPRENELIRILKKSFKAYSRDNNRDGKELANLLVKDWVCLKATYSLHEAMMPRKPTSFKVENALPIVTSLAHTTHKPMSSVPPELERQVSSEHHRRSSSISSVHPMESTSQQFVSDSSENPSDHSSRVSESSITSSRLLVDHKRYLPS